MYSFDNRSYNLFEKEFVAGYQFMKVERNGADIFYCIDWKYVVLILENFVVKMLKLNSLFVGLLLFYGFCAVNQVFKCG